MTTKQNWVFVLDPDKKPLPMVDPGRARILLTRKQAAIFRRAPFTIILKYHPRQNDSSTFSVKIDPGSKTTGMAVVKDDSKKVVFAME